MADGSTVVSLSRLKGYDKRQGSGEPSAGLAFFGLLEVGARCHPAYRFHQ